MNDFATYVAQVQGAAWGSVGYPEIVPLLSPKAHEEVETHCPHPTGIFVVAFPYYAGNCQGNLSLYARGEDYHRVVTRRLGHLCHQLKTHHPQATFWVGVDNSPLPEVSIATKAGLGILGEHGLLIVPPYGSYVFLGTIVTNLDMPFPSSLPVARCLGCKACQKACPTQARVDGKLTVNRCLSHVSQQKGDLSPQLAEALKNHPLIWGCDTCQQVCPYNQQVSTTDILEFSTNLIHQLTADDLEGLTNRTFQGKYGNRAFAWRGPTPLKRNTECR